MPGYAIDDETAIQLTDGTVEVISEGNWRLFPRGAGAREEDL
jgi:dipeptidase E